MKVELQCGDTIAIPEGCKAIVKDGSVVIEKEEQEFKNGDVLCSFYNDTMLIFKDVNKCARGFFDSHYNNKGFGDKRWCSVSFRHATEEEKKQLFAKMKEQGLRWNAEEKKVEKIRWRAKEGEDYWYISSECTVTEDTMKAEETMIGAGTIEEWKNYNHFRTEEQAEKAAEVVKEALRKYHEEIGE